MSKKLTYEYVKRYFEEQGCELLETKYISAITKMKYKCNCGNISKTIFSNFQKGHRCNQCGNKKIKEKLKLTFEYVKTFFEKHQCELLEKRYINSGTKMKYQCSCGDLSETTFNHFRTGHRCDKCGGTKRHTLEYIKQYFLNNNCELLENKYINNRTEMKYECSCGNISKTTFNKFQYGKRCKECVSKRRSGKNNHNYNHNKTDEERLIERKYPEYYRWRESIYKRNNYTCQKCQQKGKRLNAHHIKGFAENKDLRTDIDNGITLCKQCHKNFHIKYGKINIKRKHLNMFLKISNT